ncbi:hypothetical protein V757_02130 [Pelistega indica]|uniref:Uncharacterized protein n=1 Tax=Pelistega indica TaxID=1414851 RepID=V8G9Y2_9BURK|nr:hypothetical protein [Pelistega indica]ETD67542.1 hypothetical protein V757_11170 [Pelistega indica]ETD72758.1 hypothetical protein V757_02130 [Pelistega indica]
MSKLRQEIASQRRTFKFELSWMVGIILIVLSAVTFHNTYRTERIITITAQAREELETAIDFAKRRIDTTERRTDAMYQSLEELHRKLHTIEGLLRGTQPPLMRGYKTP